MAPKKVCMACPVRIECLTETMENESSWDAFGVWGGLSAPERQALRSERAVAA